MFNIILILCYFAAGIASAVFATRWGPGGPPDGCPEPTSSKADSCDSIPLAATNALQCVRHYNMYLHILQLY